MATELVDDERSFVIGGFSVVGLDTVDFKSVGFVVVGMRQALSPSPHVCSYLASPGRPHFPAQDPPLAQQVTTRVLVRPHLGHPGERRTFCVARM